MRMDYENDTLTLEMGEDVKIRLPERLGMVTITTHLATDAGHPRIRVEVESDSDRFGPADDGLSYILETGDPGVVFLTGHTREGMSGRIID